MIQDLYKPTANEPRVHPLIKRSFVFVPTAGARYAPEELILELMREVFFAKHYDENFTRARDLDPERTDENRYIHSDRERAVLHALRGRRKMTKQSKGKSFFAPAYPGLAKNGWFRKNEARVVYNFLLSGPVAQYLWNRGSGTEDGSRRQDELVEKISRALLGSSSCFEQGLEGKDILAVALGAASFNFERAVPIGNLKEKTSQYDSVIRIDDDELANRITQDLVAICDMESELPRMQWLQLLMTFLRFALPMWLLAQMQITVFLHSWLIDAADKENIALTDIVLRSLRRRNRGLLHPTLMPTRELFEQIERYMKCRVEVDILLCCLEQVRQEHVAGKTLKLESGGGKILGIDQLLTLVKNASKDIRKMERFKDVADGLDIQTFLTREGEQFAAWRNPLMRGQGKNIDEFFRVLYRAELGDETGGYLFVRESSRGKRGFRLFPGQMLLKTVTYLAAKDKCSSRQSGGAGMLVLQDVENHFGQYGIDFSTAADARPLLMHELQAMGLLTGSPDAGSSAAVACPY